MALNGRLFMRLMAISLLAFYPLRLSAQSLLLRISTTPLDMSGPGSLGKAGTPFPFQPFSELGQTFTTGTSSSALKNFTFWLDDSPDSDGLGYRSITFKAVVREWNSGTLGPVLYESAPQTTTNNHGRGGFEQFTFFPSDLTLSPNIKYVAYLTTSPFLDGNFAHARMPFGQTPYGSPTSGGGDTAGRWVSKYPDQSYWREETTLPYNDVAFELNTHQPTYGISLLYDPTRAGKAGSTIPIKLILCDSAGRNVSSPDIIVHATSLTRISESVLESGIVQDSGNANPDGDFRFDPTLGATGGYIFNLNTKGLTSGTYRLNFSVASSPLLYQAPFLVK